MGLLDCFMSEGTRLQITDIVWLDIVIGNTDTPPPAVPASAGGRIEIGLYGNLVPRTVKNFIKLSQRQSQIGVGYKGTRIHRIEKEVLIQGGALRGGTSIYGETFKDENFKLKHSKPGIVSMANLGRKDSNGTEFFITLKPLPVFDNQHVAFGEVVGGMDLVRQISSIETYGSSPTMEIRIVECGLKSR